MRKLSKKLTIVSLVVLPAILGGCFLAPRGQNTNEAVNANNTNQAGNTNQGGQEEIDTSEWKTYRNEEYGFEFRYPSQSDSYPTAPPHEVKLISNKLEIARSIILRAFTISEMGPVDYIKKVILKDADPNCIIKTLEDSERLHEGYTVYSIWMTDSTGTERVIPFTDDGIDCTEYAGSGNAYFIYNKDISNKILHIIRYQDPSMSQDQINQFLESIIIFK